MIDWLQLITGLSTAVSVAFLLGRVVNMDAIKTKIRNRKCCEYDINKICPRKDGGHYSIYKSLGCCKVQRQVDALKEIHEKMKKDGSLRLGEMGGVIRSGTSTKPPPF